MVAGAHGQVAGCLLVLVLEEQGRPVGQQQLYTTLETAVGGTVKSCVSLVVLGTEVHPLPATAHSGGAPPLQQQTHTGCTALLGAEGLLLPQLAGGMQRSLVVGILFVRVTAQIIQKCPVNRLQVASGLMNHSGFNIRSLSWVLQSPLIWKTK